MKLAVVSVSTFSKEYYSLSFTHAFPENVDYAGIYSKMHGARPLAHMSPLGPRTQFRRIEAQGHNYAAQKTPRIITLSSMPIALIPHTHT